MDPFSGRKRKQKTKCQGSCCCSRETRLYNQFILARKGSQAGRAEEIATEQEKGDSLALRKEQDIILQVILISSAPRHGGIYTQPHARHKQEKVICMP